MHYDYDYDYDNDKKQDTKSVLESVFCQQSSLAEIRGAVNDTSLSMNTSH